VTPEWMGVRDVAAELGISALQAGHLIRRLRVPVILPTVNFMRTARFRRADFRRLLEASLAPVPAPAPPPPRTSPGKAARATCAPSGDRDRLLNWKP
jgi:hypothetical protein